MMWAHLQAQKTDDGEESFSKTATLQHSFLRIVSRKMILAAHRATYFGIKSTKVPTDWDLNNSYVRTYLHNATFAGRNRASMGMPGVSRSWFIISVSICLN